MTLVDMLRAIRALFPAAMGPDQNGLALVTRVQLGTPGHPSHWVMLLNLTRHQGTSSCIDDVLAELE